MSIPERLWWIAKSRWRASDDVELNIEEQRAEAAAYEELAEALRQPAPYAPPAPTPASEAAAYRPEFTPPAPAPGQADPLAASYALLQVEPGPTLAQLDLAYHARLAETDPERYPAGSPERARAEGRRHALEAAYNKVRDCLNPTETRFEHIEF
ncbi:MAG TPA: hypothetical protein VFU47_10080 [Armatimonadota bacterium]|nr:hypothetical protein [Armatimonadota bacterium]